MDYVYKVCLRKALESLINNGLIDISLVENIYVYTDEHTTATNGKYELKEALEQEFKYGTFNSNYRHFFEPLFPDMKSIQLKLCDSSANTLIRAADIVANHIYYLMVSQNNLCAIPNSKISFFP